MVFISQGKQGLLSTRLEIVFIFLRKAPFPFRGPCVIIGVGLKICEEPPARAALESRSHKARWGSPVIAYSTETINCVFLHLHRTHCSHL